MSPLGGPGPVVLKPGQALVVNRLPLELAPVPEAQSGGGAPSVGHRRLALLDGHELGVWEMTEGTMYDVEADEAPDCCLRSHPDPRANAKCSATANARSEDSAGNGTAGTAMTDTWEMRNPPVFCERPGQPNSSKCSDITVLGSNVVG